MSVEGLWRVQRAAGVFLVLAFLPMLAGVVMYVNRNFVPGEVSPGGPLSGEAYVVWERSFLMAAVVLTALGLMVLEGGLKGSGGEVLARVGAGAYLFAAVLLVTAEALGLGQGATNVYALFVIYVLLAFLAQAAIGGALLQSGPLPAWIGWTTVVWNLGWLVLLPLVTSGDIYFPVLHHLMPLIIGGALWFGR